MTITIIAAVAVSSLFAAFDIKVPNTDHLTFFGVYAGMIGVQAGQNAHQFGSSEWFDGKTNGLRRAMLNRDACALCEIADAMFERSYFPTIGESDEWDERTFGPEVDPGSTFLGHAWLTSAGSGGLYRPVDDVEDLMLGKETYYVPHERTLDLPRAKNRLARYLDAAWSGSNAGCDHVPPQRRPSWTRRDLPDNCGSNDQVMAWSSSGLLSPSVVGAGSGYSLEVYADKVADKVEKLARLVGNYTGMTTTGGSDGYSYPLSEINIYDWHYGDDSVPTGSVPSVAAAFAPLSYIGDDGYVRSFMPSLLTSVGFDTTFPQLDYKGIVHDKGVTLSELSDLPLMKSAPERLHTSALMHSAFGDGKGLSGRMFDGARPAVVVEHLDTTEFFSSPATVSAWAYDSSWMCEDPFEEIAYRLAFSHVGVLDEFESTNSTFDLIFEIGVSYEPNSVGIVAGYNASAAVRMSMFYGAPDGAVKVTHLYNGSNAVVNVGGQWYLGTSGDRFRVYPSAREVSAEQCGHAHDKDTVSFDHEGPDLKFGYPVRIRCRGSRDSGWIQHMALTAPVERVRDVPMTGSPPVVKWEHKDFGDGAIDSRAVPPPLDVYDQYRGSRTRFAYEDAYAYMAQQLALRDRTVYPIDELPSGFISHTSFTYSVHVDLTPYPNIVEWDNLPQVGDWPVFGEEGSRYVEFNFGAAYWDDLGAIRTSGKLAFPKYELHKPKWVESHSPVSVPSSGPRALTGVTAPVVHSATYPDFGFAKTVDFDSFSSYVGIPSIGREIIYAITRYIESAGGTKFDGRVFAYIDDLWVDRSASNDPRIKMVVYLNCQFAPNQNEVLSSVSNTVDVTDVVLQAATSACRDTFSKVSNGLIMTHGSTYVDATYDVVVPFVGTINSTNDYINMPAAYRTGGRAEGSGTYAYSVARFREPDYQNDGREHTYKGYSDYDCQFDREAFRNRVTYWSPGMSGMSDSRSSGRTRFGFVRKSIRSASDTRSFAGDWLVDLMLDVCGVNTTTMDSGMMVPVLGPSLLRDAVSDGILGQSDNENFYNPKSYLSRVISLDSYDEWKFPSLDLLPTFGWPRFVIKPGIRAVSVPVAEGVITGSDKDGAAKVYVDNSEGGLRGLYLESLNSLDGLYIEYDTDEVTDDNKKKIASELHFSVYGGSPVPGENPNPYRTEPPPHGQLADSKVGAYGAIDWTWRSCGLVKRGSSTLSAAAVTNSPARATTNSPACGPCVDCGIIPTGRHEEER